MVFCTLFDSNYLDKGLVMYRSLVKTDCDFKMYVLAMDDKCKEVLDSYNYNNLITFSLDSFSDEVGLSDVRKTRPRGEFCWTCTSFLIDYVLTKCNEPICTYVDSDLYFYSDPQCLIDEMGDKTVQIVEHRFSDSMIDCYRKSQSGTYCVQFNTFKNTSDALELLRWWKSKCLESCSIDNPNSGVFGDQGYLENWGDKYNVSVLKHLGGGVAPWNVGQYQLAEDETVSMPPLLLEKKTQRKFDLVFYHFHHITYYEAHKVNTHVYVFGNADDSLIRHLYIPYLRALDETKNELKERFDVYPLLMSHPGMREYEKKKLKFGDLIRKLRHLNVLKKMILKYDARRQKRDEWKNIISF